MQGKRRNTDIERESRDAGSIESLEPAEQRHDASEDVTDHRTFEQGEESDQLGDESGATNVGVENA
jgi:hypothetical protein